MTRSSPSKIKRITKQIKKDTVLNDLETMPKRRFHNCITERNNIEVTIESRIPIPKDSDWFVGVTAAPRKKQTIQVTLDSLHTAGWAPIIFAEPDTHKVDGYKYINNSVRLGAWYNWLQLIKYGLSTNAKYILSVQDDTQFHPGSREVAEYVMFPDNQTGFISLYTAKQYSEDRSGNSRPFGLNRIHTSSFWGACALIFSRHAAYQIINHPSAINWTGIPPSTLNDTEKKELEIHKKENPYLIQNVDTAIGRIVNALHLNMYVVDPSPVRHTATVSSIGHGSNTNKRNCSRCASHSISLMDQVFPKRIR